MAPVSRPWTPVQHIQLLKMYDALTDPKTATASETIEHFKESAELYVTAAHGQAPLTARPQVRAERARTSVMLCRAGRAAKG